MRTFGRPAEHHPCTGSAADNPTCPASVFQDLPRVRNPREQIPDLRNEKGGVVRRPFSTLQAWLIAVSPQPGVAVAIGTTSRSLEPRREGDGAGVPPSPARSVSEHAPPGRNCFEPLAELTRAAAASLPIVSDRTVIDSPTAGVTQERLTAHPSGVDCVA